MTTLLQLGVHVFHKNAFTAVAEISHVHYLDASVSILASYNILSVLKEKIAKIYNTFRCHLDIIFYYKSKGFLEIDIYNRLKKRCHVKTINHER